MPVPDRCRRVLHVGLAVLGAPLVCTFRGNEDARWSAVEFSHTLC